MKTLTTWGINSDELFIQRIIQLYFCYAEIVDIVDMKNLLKNKLFRR